MVIGKISSLATTIMIFAVGLIFLKQAYATSIGASGQDVGAGFTGVASGVTNLINSFVSPITGLISIFSNFFGGFTGIRTVDYGEPSPTGRDERNIPEQKTKTSDTWNPGPITSTAGSSGGYTSGAITAHRATGGFGRAN